jgi:hypothetical protein
MTVTLDLPPAVEQRLTERASQRGQSLTQYLVWLAAREAAESEPTAAPPPPIAYPPEFASPEEWSKAFREWVSSHPTVSHFVDDSRESIYEGRGE